MYEPLTIIVGNSEHKVLLETTYISKAFFYVEFDASSEHEFTDEQTKDVAEILHQAYLKTKISLDMNAYVQAIRELSYKEIKELSINDIIDMACDMDV